MEGSMMEGRDRIVSVYPLGNWGAFRCLAGLGLATTVRDDAPLFGDFLIFIFCDYQSYTSP